MPSYSSKQKSSFVIKTCEKEGNTKKNCIFRTFGDTFGRKSKSNTQTSRLLLDHCVSFGGKTNVESLLAGTQTLFQF